jgi:RimJ/RimL family protein N-acetyltransferase
MMLWSEADVGFRPLATDNLPLLYDWLGREHVRRWWGELGGYDEAVAEYLDAIEGRDPADVYAIELRDQAVGFVQTYLHADYPVFATLVDAGDEVAGLDLLLGEERLTGSGLGTYVIRAFASAIVFARAETKACVADPDVRNLASIRAFEKAGFKRVRDYHDPEDGEMHALMRLDRPLLAAE